jgi:Concanavalin A-like lectin/glucanases superfamily/CARDB/NHL repeat/Galactose oxidase, central domain
MGKQLRLGLLAAVVLCTVVAALVFCVALVKAFDVYPDRRASAPDGVDLDVTFIDRSPLYQAYCVEYPWDIPGQPGIPFLCPGTEDDPRWPEQGEVVTFTAHIVNKGTVASPAFGYAWQIDGAVVASGTLPALAPAAEVTATYQWPWAHTMSADGQRAMDDHTVGFFADPADVVSETHETNNSLTDPTNAMSFQIYITPEMYDAYNIPVDPQWPWSTEDWLQKQIATMNWDFAASTYPVAPQGATVRVRIDKIVVSSTEPPADGHDGGWFVNADYRHGASAWYDPVTDIDWALIHELSHQVSIIDLYQIGASAPDVRVTDRLGNPLNAGFSWPRPDLMGGGDIWPHTDGHLYSSHVAAGASTFEGYRNGYYGCYMFDIPLENYFHVLDNQGNPAPNVQVTLYQRAGWWDWMSSPGFDATPEISGTTDANGLFLLTNRSAHGGTVTANGHVLHDNPFGVVDIIGSQNLFLVHLQSGDHEEIRWLDITELNLAYWMGDTISHTFTISSHVPPPGAPQAPVISGVQAQGDWARVCWQDSGSPDVTGYRLYRATAPMSEYELVAEVGSGPCLEDTYSAGNYGGKVYAVTAVGGNGLESGFSSFGWAPTLSTPASVVITPQGQRLILDPRNGYALMRQDAGGAYRQYVGSVHYHLENSQYMALEANQHLLFSHPGDWYTDRHSVRVAGLDATPLLEFGERGSGPGQFETPAGVASWGEAWSYGGPYQVDDHTLLLLHLDGSYDGAQGEHGTASGTTFELGRYGQGVLVDNTDTLTYTTSGNLDRTAGAIEFWLRPNWDGDDGQDYAFFEVGTSWYNGIRLAKDGANNLRFLMWAGSTEYGIAHNVADWKAGEWHHIAATWQEGEIALYEDGVQVGRDTAHVPDLLSGPLYVGSGAWDGRVVDGVLDEFRISDVPRLGNSQECSHILVADSGNHRIQAFDSLGHYITEFGSPGSGPGQFDDPQGLAVDGSGRVIVTDRGNNRLQILSYDGQAFGYLDSYEAGFNAPTGVAVDAKGNIAVADTGNDRIVLLNVEGNLLAEYTEPNDGYTGLFNAPRGVAIEADGDLVVADTGNQRVVTVRRAGYRYYLPLALKDYLPSGAVWQRQFPWSYSPWPRCCMGFVYDSARHLIVLVGGGNWNWLSSDTWEYDGTNWTLRTDLIHSAPVRWTAPVAYNPDDQVTVLFGGTDEIGFHNDTWQYDGLTWAPIDTLTAPSPRNGARMAYDRSRQRMVLFGGYYGPGGLFFDDTWEYSDGQWTQRTPTHHPPARESSTLAYDARRGVVVLFGGGRDAGSTVYGDTWEWDGTDWTQRLDLPASPPARWAHSMTYDEGRQRIVLFGGLTGVTDGFNDTWEYDGQTWTQVRALHGPSARWDAGLAYDVLNRRTVLFGGMYWDGGFGWWDDTWHYGAP